MIAVDDKDIIFTRHTTGGRFVLFCSTDLPTGCPLPWWSAMMDTGGDGAAILTRADESCGPTGWTLLALLTVATERARAEVAVRRSMLLTEAIHHLDAAVALERARRGGLPVADCVVLHPAGPGAGWPWLVAEFGDETLAFAATLTGDGVDGVPLELVLLTVDQLVTDAVKALPDQGCLGGIAVHVGKALQAIAARDQFVRSRPTPPTPPPAMEA